MADPFWNERLEKTKELIVAYEDAVLAFKNNGDIQEYRLDTGQQITKVTRANIDVINRELDTLYNRYQIFAMRCGLTNVVYSARTDR